MRRSVKCVTLLSIKLRFLVTMGLLYLVEYGLVSDSFLYVNCKVEEFNIIIDFILILRYSGYDVKRLSGG